VKDKKGVIIVSGGMDSVTLAHLARSDVGPDGSLHLVSFDYGQKHKKELEYASECAVDIDADWHTIDLTNITSFLTGSALTDPSIEVPQGHYADETMKLTVVPNRNMMMLSVATAIAVAEGADFVATGVHAGDHPIYPDCRPEFIESCNTTAQRATKGFAKQGFQIVAPFVWMSKDQIVSVGARLNPPVDYSKTWSCYEGGAVHCGKCGTCVERKEAFSLAGEVDPTEYASTPEPSEVS